MSVKCSVFIATSLDGFISRSDGSIDWLNAANAQVPASEDCGYGHFFAGVDALVMGRHTFEMALSFETWPYESKPVIVLSSYLGSLPSHAPHTATLMNDAPATVISRLSARGMQHLYIDGGVTIQRFMSAALIDDITITTIPVLIGEGRRLFGTMQGDVLLDHVSTRAFPFGFVQSHYRVVRKRD